MKITLAQKKEAYRKLSWQIQDFIMDPETTDLIDEALKNLDLSLEQLDSADSEILYALYRLQSLTDAIKNIAALSGRDIKDFEKTRNILEEKIFEPLFILAEELEKKKEEENKIEMEEKSTRIIKGSTDNRIREIGIKYSLTEKQVDTLENIIPSLNLDPNLNEKVFSFLSEKLQISKLLSEQIVNDIRKRFRYSLSTIATIPQKEEEGLEIKPDFSPAISEQKAHNTTPEEKSWFGEVSSQQPVVNGKENVKNATTPDNLPGATEVSITAAKQTDPSNASNLKPSEPVQKPTIGVPRYMGGGVAGGAVASSEQLVVREIPNTPTLNSGENANIVDQKLNSVFSSAKRTEEIKSEEKISSSGYTTGQDPYREPIE